MLIPVVATVMVVGFLLDKIGAPISDVFFRPFTQEILPDGIGTRLLLNFLATIVVLALITIFGFLSNYFIGKLSIKIAERLITHVPFVSTVYKTVKQIVETFGRQQKAVFQKVVLIEFPRKGAYTIGFITGSAQAEVTHRSGKQLVNVFIPTTPNPTSGFFIMFPAEEVIALDMSVGDGMKSIVSFGAVCPTWNGDQVPATEKIAEPEAKPLK